MKKTGLSGDCADELRSELDRDVESIDGERAGNLQSTLVEFWHAWIKSKLGLRKFHLRGLAKVQMEMLWACLTYNFQQWIRLRSSA